MEYLRRQAYVSVAWRLPAVPDALSQLPCKRDTLVRRIRAGKPVIMAVDCPGAEEPFGEHTMVVCGVSECAGVSRLTIMDPADGTTSVRTA